MRDTFEEESIQQLKDGWENKEPGRSTRAKKSRKRFLAKIKIYHAINFLGNVTRKYTAREIEEKGKIPLHSIQSLSWPLRTQTLIPFSHSIPHITSHDFAILGPSLSPRHLSLPMRLAHR